MLPRSEKCPAWSKYLSRIFRTQGPLPRTNSRRLARRTKFDLWSTTRVSSRRRILQVRAHAFSFLRCHSTEEAGLLADRAEMAQAVGARDICGNPVLVHDLGPQFLPQERYKNHKHGHEKDVVDRVYSRISKCGHHVEHEYHKARPRANVLNKEGESLRRFVARFGFGQCV